MTGSKTVVFVSLILMVSLFMLDNHVDAVNVDPQ